MTRALCAALAFLLLSPVPAQGDPWASVIGEDDRVMLDSHRWPWSAIGRLNRESGGHCTGTLVAADVVLTAGHCLDDARTGRQVRPKELHFLAGYRRGDYLFHARGARIVRPEPPASVAQSTMARRSRDWALIRLDKRSQQPPIPLQPVNAEERGKLSGADLTDFAIPVMRAGYSRDRAHLLSLHDGCSIARRPAAHPVLLHDCDALEGDSGSPLLRQTADGVAIVGVTSAVITSAGAATGQYRVGIAVDAAAFQAALERFLQPDAAEGRPRN